MDQSPLIMIDYLPLPPPSSWCDVCALDKSPHNGPSPTHTSGKEEARARDLFYGLWINDLFMERVEANEDWSLFCPNEAPGLAEVWGDQFNELYTK